MCRATRGQSESNRDTSNLLRDSPMRSGRVNTYHNDPFVAAPANNAFVIALSRFLPVVCTTVVAGVVLTASLASHCFIPVFICPALLHRAVSISDRSTAIRERTTGSRS